MSNITSPTTLKPRPKAGILDIEAYVGGKSKIAGVSAPIKLSSNENVLGSSPLAVAAFESCARKLQLYPDGAAAGLREAVAGKYGLEPERLIFGCGSDEIFGLIAHTFCEPGDNVVQGEYGFLEYSIAGRAAQAEVRSATMPHLRFDVDQALALVDDHTRVVFFGQPRQPHRRLARRERDRAPAPGPARKLHPRARRRLCRVRRRSGLSGRDRSRARGG